MLQNSLPITVGRKDLETMYSFVQVMHELQGNPEYISHLSSQLPDTVLFDPGNESVLMGYDFHLAPEGPRLIEINNDAGGLFTDSGWLTQPRIPELSESIEMALLEMFPDAWKLLAIVDEDIDGQYMYPEMLAFSDLLTRHGRQVHLVNPEKLHLDQNHFLCLDTGEKIDAIYNRHTDFYLQSQELAHIRSSYLSGRVQLTPNPRSYGLLGDKRRMVDWWHPGLLESLRLTGDEIDTIRGCVPEIHLLSELDSEVIWKDRRQWVFKPVARHGGKGVLLGRSMSRKRFSAMPPSETVVQRYIPASEVLRDGQCFKVDVRLYTHADRLVALAGRVYQGMLTNFRAPGSGFVPINIIS